MSDSPLVSVTIVTYNSARFIRRCLESVVGQLYEPTEIIVVDNASTDETGEILQHFEGRFQVVYNEENIGFAAAQNQAIAHSSGDWVLTLNPDVLLSPDFLSRLLSTAAKDPRAGTVCGKLLLADSRFRIEDRPRMDSTGMFFTPTLRHMDRGCMEVDLGHYRDYEYVFGATAAAACYRREMIDDISVDDEFFDSAFFTYREDADVAWRAQLLGWRCIFNPWATACHVRTLRPGMRNQMPAEINMHSVKNRFLMRFKNITSGLYLRNIVPITVRDLGVFAYCVVFERSSLRAFYHLARDFGGVLRKRRSIQARRRTNDGYMANWFRSRPVSVPLRAQPARGARKQGEILRRLERPIASVE
jgi:GT2 family glycosyltransferase